MSKLFITLAIIIFFFITIGNISCSFPSKKNINHLLMDKIEDVEVEVEDLGQLIIVKKISNLLTPLFFGMFVGVLLIVLGLRIIGLSVLLSSITCIILIIMMSVYLKLIAVIGIVVLLIGIFFLGKNYYDNYRFKREMVNSVEEAKLFVKEEDRKILKTNLEMDQSDYTKKVVKGIKNGKKPKQ